jgi:hypothetical protein
MQTIAGNGFSAQRTVSQDSVCARMQSTTKVVLFSCSSRVFDRLLPHLPSERFNVLLVESWITSLAVDNAPHPWVAWVASARPRT